VPDGPNEPMSVFLIARVVTHHSDCMLMFVHSQLLLSLLMKQGQEEHLKEKHRPSVIALLFGGK